jgi:hypothetical protein
MVFLPVGHSVALIPKLYQSRCGFGENHGPEFARVIGGAVARV